ncbi:MAG: nucleoside hydrolase, partial [Oscillospiraceae bacterium]|nr:nucleoside hydrolase [Oscillospiraceae bacterium]
VEGLSFAPGHAWDFIWDQANRYPGELEIVAVGPLTNIAITVLKHPDIVQFVKQVVVMGGAATTGNVTPYAEFNIWQDPHAANIVLNAGFDLTLVDLDCCYTAYLDKEDQKTVLETVKSTSIADLIEGFARFEEENLAALARSDELLEQFSNRYVMCDPTAAAICIDPSIAETVDKHVIVDVDGKLTIGQTVVDWFGFTGRPNVHLARRVDRKRFVELYLNCLRSYRREEL